MKQEMIFQRNVVNVIPEEHHGAVTKMTRELLSKMQGESFRLPVTELATGTGMILNETSYVW